MLIVLWSLTPTLLVNHVLGQNYLQVNSHSKLTTQDLAQQYNLIQSSEATQCLQTSNIYTILLLLDKTVWLGGPHGIPQCLLLALKRYPSTKLDIQRQTC